VGCGPPFLFQRVTLVSSHEMAEAITDAQVGSASVFGPPLGWYDNPPNLGEIADLCDPAFVQVTIGSQFYSVEPLFSNLQNDCVSAPPILKITAPPQAGPNGAFNATLEIQSSLTHLNLSGYTGTVHFTSSDPLAVLPADYTFVAGDAGAHTFSFTLNTLGDQTITATDVHSSGFIGSTTVNVNTSEDLTIVKTHTGNFVVGQTGATYTLTVSNVGGGVTSGTVTVTDALPAGLSATAIAGAGWSCTLATLTCTRADALFGGNSYPVITLTVNVTATSPTTVTNSATVSGGGDTNAANNTAGNPTVIAAPVPDLRVAVSGNTSVNQGTTGYTYTTSISNVGTLASSGSVFVNNTLGQGLTATAISGTGWTCTLATVSCTRTDPLAPGASYPDITVTLNIALNAPGSTTILSVVSGGGAASNAAGINLFVSPPVSITSNTPSATVSAGQAAQYTIGMNIGPAAGTVTFACSGLPTASSCSFNPTSLTSSGNVVMTVNTTARGAVIETRRLPNQNPWLPLGLFCFAAMAALAWQLRCQPRARKRVPIFGACALALMLAWAGCGGGGTPQTITNPVVGTPAGTYTLTFTATSPNGSANKTMTLTVN
jgi:uncharacterized repeat protein (TIGR01451 family)